MAWNSAPDQRDVSRSCKTERYLSQGEFGEGSLTYLLSSTLLSSLSAFPQHSQNLSDMYPCNFGGAGSYYSDHSAILASGELPNRYPSTIPPPVVGQFATQTRNTFIDTRGMTAPQRYPIVSGPLGAHGTPSFRKYHHKLFSDWYLMHESSEPVAGATFYTDGPGGYNQPSFPNYHWPAVSQQPQPHPHPQCAGSLSWDTLVAGNVMMPEASTSLPASSTGKNSPLCNLREPYAHLFRTAPFHYWGENQNGATTTATTTLDWVSAGLGSSPCHLTDASHGRTHTL